MIKFEDLEVGALFFSKPAYGQHGLVVYEIVEVNSEDDIVLLYLEDKTLETQDFKFFNMWGYKDWLIKHRLGKMYYL